MVLIIISQLSIVFLSLLLRIRYLPYFVEKMRPKKAGVLLARKGKCTIFLRKIPYKM